MLAKVLMKKRILKVLIIFLVKNEKFIRESSNVRFTRRQIVKSNLG